MGKALCREEIVARLRLDRLPGDLVMEEYKKSCAELRRKRLKSNLSWCALAIGGFALLTVGSAVSFIISSAPRLMCIAFPLVAGLLYLLTVLSAYVQHRGQNLSRKACEMPVERAYEPYFVEFREAFLGSASDLAEARMALGARELSILGSIKTLSWRLARGSNDPWGDSTISETLENLKKELAKTLAVQKSLDGWMSRTTAVFDSRQIGLENVALLHEVARTCRDPKLRPHVDARIERIVEDIRSCLIQGELLLSFVAQVAEVESVEDVTAYFGQLEECASRSFEEMH